MPPGGTIRDLLLDRHPVFWMADVSYLVVILSAALLTLVYVRYRRTPDNALAVADAFGVGLFTIGGAQIAERAGRPALIVTLMATMTGVAGGVLRDVLSAQVPFILRRGNIYATASIFGAMTYLLLMILERHVPLDREGGDASRVPAVLRCPLARDGRPRCGVLLRRAPAVPRSDAACRGAR